MRGERLIQKSQAGALERCIVLRTGHLVVFAGEDQQLNVLVEAAQC